MGGIGGCPNVGGICIGCTMPGFPDRFMPFGSAAGLESVRASISPTGAIRALRRFNRDS
jgi:hydrogenase small subunit